MRGLVSSLLTLFCTLLWLGSLPGTADAQPPEPPATMSRSGHEDLGTWWRGLPEEERQLLRKGDRRFDDLPAEKQQRIRERWERFQKMSPDEKQQLRERYERWRNLSPEERQKLRRTYQKFKQLPPEQRQQLRRELHQLRDLPDPQREERREQLRQRYFPNEKTFPGADWKHRDHGGRDGWRERGGGHGSRR